MPAAQKSKKHAAKFLYAPEIRDFFKKSTKQNAACPKPPPFPNNAEGMPDPQETLG